MGDRTPWNATSSIKSPDSCGQRGVQTSTARIGCATATKSNEGGVACHQSSTETSGGIHRCPWSRLSVKFHFLVFHPSLIWVGFALFHKTKFDLYGMNAFCVRDAFLTSVSRIVVVLTIQARKHQFLFFHILFLEMVVNGLCTCRK